MTVFKVQIWNVSTTGYETHTSYKPEYVMSVMLMPRRWWCPWPRYEIGVIANLRPAEEIAWQRALHHARILRKKVKTRISRESEIGGKEIKAIIWDNGKTLDVSLLPWYRRLYRMLTSAPHKASRSRT